VVGVDAQAQAAVPDTEPRPGGAGGQPRRQGQHAGMLAQPAESSTTADDPQSPSTLHTGIAGDLPVEVDRPGDAGVEVQRRGAGGPIREHSSPRMVRQGNAAPDSPSVRALRRARPRALRRRRTVSAAARGVIAERLRRAVALRPYPRYLTTHSCRPARKTVTTVVRAQPTRTSASSS
jgi:hypothetical protein